MDIGTIDDLARKLADSLPAAASALKDDLQRNFKAVLQSGLAQMELVTRREFDVQAGVLKHTRDKLQELERRLAGLESRQP